ncbi:Imm21 family immunity protein [Saccharomonospora halophila]|uniref:Imm21 family immunity protein n=1 Tax=Saccharomonospora halophila TaxID=129922 RepID=UPI0009FF919D|nr:Imm21 family immunity protein [Saccharomonospora halophila]
MRSGGVVGDRWVETEGGPLIGIPESVLEHWSGVFGADGGTDDYARACAVRELVGAIDVGGRTALILAGEPSDTTYLPEMRVFVRVLSQDAEDDEAVIAAVSEAAAGARWEWETEFVVHEPLVVFDSALGFDRLREGDWLRVEMPTGRHQVWCADVDVPDVAELRLVQFRLE